MSTLKKTVAEKDNQMAILQEKYDRLLLKQIEKEERKCALKEPADKTFQKYTVSQAQDNEFIDVCNISFADKLRDTNERLNKRQKEIMNKDYRNSKNMQITELEKNKTINLKEITEQLENYQNCAKRSIKNCSDFKVKNSKISDYNNTESIQNS